MRIVSCNPLEMKDPELPPTFSGLPLDDRSGWDEFRAEYARAGRRGAAVVRRVLRRARRAASARARPIHESPWLNLYLYPDELDYPRSRPLGSTWRNLQTSVRATDAPWSPPEPDGRALVYLSLGSLGSADVSLMQRLVAELADTPHRYVVCTGPQHASYELAENMVGEEFLPQTSVLPHVDAVITHGGNNTTTECMWFGKPMLVLPIFWDQHDNAQRVQRDRLRRPPPDLRLRGRRARRDSRSRACGRPLHARCAAAGSRLRERPGTTLAAELIEQLATS